MYVQCTLGPVGSDLFFVAVKSAFSKFHHTGSMIAKPFIENQCPWVVGKRVEADCVIAVFSSHGLGVMHQLCGKSSGLAVGGDGEAMDDKYPAAIAPGHFTVLRCLLPVDRDKAANRAMAACDVHLLLPDVGFQDLPVRVNLVPLIDVMGSHVLYRVLHNCLYHGIIEKFGRSYGVHPEVCPLLQSLRVSPGILFKFKELLVNVSLAQK